MFSVSGSHWALMVYQRHNNTFYYLDSAGSYNLTYAQKFANKIYPYIDAKKKDKDNKKEQEEKKEDNKAKEENIDYIKVLNNFIKIKVPQQENGYDCGMYVVEYTRFVAKYFMEHIHKRNNNEQQKQFPCISNVPFFKNKQNINFDGDHMIEMRKHWRQTINDMSAQQKNNKK